MKAHQIENYPTKDRPKSSCNGPKRGVALAVCFVNHVSENEQSILN